MSNIFKDFEKLSDKQSLDNWINKNKDKIFELKKETNLKWKVIADQLTEHLGQEKLIRPSVLTEYLSLKYFICSKQPIRKYE